MKLGRLCHLEKIELNQEQEGLVSNIAEWDMILQSPDKLNEIFLDRLSSLDIKFHDSRKTEITQLVLEKEKKETPKLPPEECVLIVNNNGAAKRIAAKNFKVAKRNTVGVKTNGDIIAYSNKTNTEDVLMVFTNLGRMYRLLVENIPEGSNTSAATSISNLVEFEQNEIPMAYTTLSRGTAYKYIFFATKNGMVKKVPLEEYDKIKRTGVAAIKLKETDELASVTFIDDEQILLVTSQGMTIRFPTKDMPISSRIAMGVKGMNLNDGDSVLTALPISNSADYLAIVSEGGLGKRTKLDEFPLQNRNGKGLICYKGTIAGATLVKEEDKVLINGDRTAIVVSASDLPILTRTSNGNAMIKSNSKVISITKV